MAPKTDSRQQELIVWLEQHGYPNASLHPASSDASARRYFRFEVESNSLIAVDSPQPQSENQSFLDIAHAISQVGLSTPTIFQSDLDHGWMLLEDFGSQTFAQAVANTQDQTKLYSDALSVIHKLQKSSSLQNISDNLPRYDESMIRRELTIFSEWCLENYLGIRLSSNDLADWQSLSSVLIRAFGEQPQCFVHRDFHSRNLMLLEDGELGLLDFQGAVKGPITYDWVSLLRDCYIALPPNEVQQHLASAYEKSLQSHLCQMHSLADTRRWFEYTGLQRHLKAIGIFCRLKKLESKDTYVEDIPRTFNYVLDVVDRYIELAPLKRLIERHGLEAHLC